MKAYGVLIKDLWDACYYIKTVYKKGVTRDRCMRRFHKKARQRAKQEIKKLD